MLDNRCTPCYRGRASKRVTGIAPLKGAAMSLPELIAFVKLLIDAIRLIVDIFFRFKKNTKKKKKK